MATPQERRRATDEDRGRKTESDDTSPTEMHASQRATETDDATSDEFTKEAREMTETGPGRGAD